MAKFKGTDGEDTYTLKEGKRDVVQMLGGNDIVSLSAAALDSSDRIDAGAGVDDQAFLQDGGFYNLRDGRFTGFESMSMFGKGAFEVYLSDSVAAADTTFNIFGGGSSVDQFQPDSLFLDGAAERDASLLVYATGGDDVLIGGGRNDEFQSFGGDDLMTGNEGADTFVFLNENGGARDNWGDDRITDFRPGEDHLIINTETISKFRQLIITDGPDGAVIQTPDSESSITLYGVLARDIHKGDITIQFNPGQVDPVSHAPMIPHDHGLLV